MFNFVSRVGEIMKGEQLHACSGFLMFKASFPLLLLPTAFDSANAADDEALQNSAPFLETQFNIEPSTVCKFKGIDHPNWQ